MVIPKAFKFLIIGAVALGVAACAKEDQNKKSPLDDRPIQFGDKSSCNYQPGEVISQPIGSFSRLVGAWQALDRKENATIRELQTLDFKTVNGSTNVLEITLSTICELKSQGRGSMVTVISQGFDQIGNFTIEQDRFQESNETIAGTQVNCEAALSRGTYLYSFKDKCLVFADQYFVRRSQ